MKRCAVLISFLAVSVWAIAQTQTTQSGNSAFSNAQAPQQTMVVPGGLSTNTGGAVIVVPPAYPLAVTPEFHLGTVNPGIGATNATPGNFAGALNSTTSMPVVPRVITTIPQFSTAGIGVMQTVLAPETGAVPAFSSTAAAGTSNRLVFDRGVGAGSVAFVSASPAGLSLGEIARANRQHEASLNARIYTNQDINRINSQPGLTMGGISGAAVGAGSTTQQQPSGNIPTVAQPSANQPGNPGLSQPAPPSNNAPRSEAVPPSPLGTMQARRQMAQNTPPGNPAQPSSNTSSPESSNPAPSSAQQAPSRLPSAGSILPLMTLVGILAAGAGLLSR